ncbi:MAG: hypothetical protein WC718_04840 [Phycisphaerales bacterium]|jgi:hypothetical protein
MDEYAALCETCGYDFEGLDHDSKCPECGRSVASSDPAARPGSPWQRQPGLFSLAATAWEVLRHPSRLFEQIQIRPGSAGLAAISMLLAGALVADPWIGVWVRDPARNVNALANIGSFVRYGMSFVVGAVGVGLTFLVLTLIEYRGIRFFSGRRGWRLTKVAAWQICAHASVAWVLCGILPLVVLALKEASVRWLHYAPNQVLNLGPALPTLSVQDLIGGGGVVLGYFLGMMAFEMLVYVGVRKCRYAARMRVATKPAFAPSPATT